MHLWHVEEPLEYGLHYSGMYNYRVNVLHERFTLHMFAERSRAASGVYLPSMSTQANLVQFSCVLKQVSSEPKVCLCVPCVHATTHFLCRLVHSFTCAGMLPVQYSKFTQFAGLGVLGTSYISRSKHLISTNWKQHHHIIVQYIGRVATSGWCRKWQISPCKKLWTRCALSQDIILKERWVKFVFVNGNVSDSQPQWVMTDARHDSTSNAYHTTVACLSGRYGIVGVYMYMHAHIYTIYMHTSCNT